MATCQAVGQVPVTLIKWAAGVVGIPCEVVATQINEESGGNPRAVSPTGAQGVAQFEPGTWQDQHCGGSPFTVNDAMKCYAKYMYELVTQFHGNVRDALAAYNAGPGNLQAGYGYADQILAAAGQPSGLAAGGGTGAVGAQTTGLLTPSDCVWKLPQLPVVGTPGCLLSYGQARALLGGGLMLAGGFTLVVGLLVLAAAGLKQSGAGHAAGSTLETVGAGVAFVPGAEPAGLAIAGAGAAAKRAGSSSGASQSVARRRQARAQRAAPAAKTSASAAPASAAPARTESTAREPEKQVEAPGRFNYRRAAA